MEILPSFQSMFQGERSDGRVSLIDASQNMLKSVPLTFMLPCLWNMLSQALEYTKQKLNQRA